MADAAFGGELVTNVFRGHVAEAIVASALEPEWTWCSADYASRDFERRDGLRAEVKQTAARQTWAAEGAAPSVGSFDIAERKGRYEGTLWIEEAGRPAHLYIFAHHPLNDDNADHRDPTQWLFYVVASRSLPPIKRIGIAALCQLASPCGYSELRTTVNAVASELP